ncbi:glucose-6-phosphate dehydrogenase assembly protein OpcA [Allostreptomyces psammosilenae]|uniref:Glucose-6-phosphate dehydrogenase assembly protein OpcA n=1 Tax=Allostreptomyces psammosilenae TaxID=1892865 RepID=A0A853A9R4_9ACTN|nr:glucose-6-phosphate dehydrogenase assembly protein OpcA [Allostreptomyces psammosilenae]NYI07248.1 glucose-6-phosphate dehydrogenase assembly protein OpcA [Allostreptomyces psammosilenae]
MIIDLTDTTSSRINSALVDARRSSGSPAVGMVLTLVIVTDEGNHYDALKAASEASHEHPCRILTVIKRPGRTSRARSGARLDAEVRVGGEAGAGETVLLRLHGELADHAESVVLPLLLPDAPVVVWWPEDAPNDPGRDPLGSLAARRITDAGAAETPLKALEARARFYSPGDTDLAWTRATPWRSMLAAALDQPHTALKSAVVEGEAGNATVDLVRLWLSSRLGVPVDRRTAEGNGISRVALTMDAGELCLHRTEPSSAVLTMPGQPDRQVALKERDIAELMAEELRRLDPDEAYEATLRHGLELLGSKAAGKAPATETSEGAEGAEGAAAPAAGAAPAEAPAAEAPAESDASASADAGRRAGTGAEAEPAKNRRGGRRAGAAGAGETRGSEEPEHAASPGGGKA